MNPKIKKIGILKKMMGSFTGTTSDRSVDNISSTDKSCVGLGHHMDTIYYFTIHITIINMNSNKDF